MTLFASSGNARTYNYEAGDVSYVPATYGMIPVFFSVHSALHVVHRTLR